MRRPLQKLVLSLLPRDASIFSNTKETPLLRMKRSLLLIALALLPLIGRADNPKPVGIEVARTFPYSMIGQLTFFSGDGAYVGSATTVQPRGIITAGHNLYDAFAGWSTDVVFNRGHYDSTNLAVRYATRIFVLSGYQENVTTYGGDDVSAFRRDTGGAIFKSKVAAGGYLGWSTDKTLLTSSAARVALGYGAEIHSGDQLLSVAAVKPFAAVNGAGAFFESLGTGIEAGMSGGPLIGTLPDGSPTLCGVVISGSDDPVAGGVRRVNGGTSDFILRYLSSTTGQ